MPKDEADPEDPMTIVGVELPAESDEQLADMTDCFIEEFARMGWPREKILKMFRMSFYAAAHRILLTKGEKFILDRMELLAPFFERPPTVPQETEAPHA